MLKRFNFAFRYTGDGDAGYLSCRAQMISLGGHLSFMTNNSCIRRALFRSSPESDILYWCLIIFLYHKSGTTFNVLLPSIGKNGRHNHIVDKIPWIHHGKMPGTIRTVKCVMFTSLSRLTCWHKHNVIVTSVTSQDPSGSIAMEVRVRTIGASASYVCTLILKRALHWCVNLAFSLPSKWIFGFVTWR